MGLWVARQWQGQGYGHRALALLVDYAHNHLGLHQLYVNIPVFNTACLQLFDDCDFTLAGTLKSWIRRGGRYHDVNILQHIC